MTITIVGPAADALRTLTPSQVKFLQQLPKAELHAHLNGSIPLATLQELAREYTESNQVAGLSESVQSGVLRLQNGVELNEIHDFFNLFSAIYAVTANPDALGRATRAVLHEFLDGENPQCTYLELRTTPKQTNGLSRTEYLNIVLDEVEKYPAEKASLIVSLDRRMAHEDAQECISIAIKLKSAGRRVVGIDLCGDPLAGDMEHFLQYFKQAKAANLGVTLHIAETHKNPSSDTLTLLSSMPDRLGHATFLDEEAKNIALKNKMCIEICLSSNLLCKTVQTLDEHHIRFYLKRGHPIAICTDDILPFRNSMLGEYALLLAQRPLGLGLSEDEVRRIAEMSLDSIFKA